jgi:hypothetical protein
MHPVPSFTFAVINDLHYVDPGCRPWLEGAIRHVNAIPGLELVLVLGDLAETGAPDELAHARDLLHLLRVPCYTVPGNHDGPPNRPLNSGPGLDAYESLFPRRRNYTFTHKSWQFLALDTTNGSAWQHVPIPHETLEFARHAAATLNPAAPSILFTHMPLEPSIRFSSSQGYELLRLLLPLNLRLVFNGHFHGLTEHPAPPPSPPHLKLLTNRGLSHCRELHDGSTQRAYFLCRANPDQSVSFQHVQYTGP